MKQRSYYHHIWGLAKCLLSLTLSTAVALSLESLGVNEINLILIYLIAILLTTLETKGYFWGAITCIAVYFSLIFSLHNQNTPLKYLMQTT